jgi:PAS domain-containing protein
MKRLLLTGFLGLMLMGQMHGAASSSNGAASSSNGAASSSINIIELTAAQLPKCQGTLAQLADGQSYLIPHEAMPLQYDVKTLCQPSNQCGELFKFVMPQSNCARADLLYSARQTNDYKYYNMFTYAGWSASIFAALAFGLYGMHTAKILHVNWKHMLFSASLASALASIYCATRDNHVESDDIENIIALRTEKRSDAICRLALGYFITDEDERITTINRGFCHLLNTEPTCTEGHRRAINGILSNQNFSETDSLPMLNCGNNNRNGFTNYFELAHYYLCYNLASDKKLGALLAAKEKPAIPAYIPIATIAAGLVSGVGLARDYGLFTRIQG